MKPSKVEALKALASKEQADRIANIEVKVDLILEILMGQKKGKKSTELTSEEEQASLPDQTTPEPEKGKAKK